MRPPGYVLWVDPKSIDAVRFEQALAASRELEPPERAAALREALDLWRGTPFADLAFETFPQGEIARLEELPPRRARGAPRRRAGARPRDGDPAAK